MKLKSNVLANIIALPIMLALLVGAPPQAPAASPEHPHLLLMKADQEFLPLHPFRAPQPPSGPKPIEWPEYYIDPTLEHGLNLVLPPSVRSGLEVEAFYDRWEGLPTLQAEYFHPIIAAHNRSFFVCPRISVTSRREGYSLDLGVRQMITPWAMTGFRVFHDWVRDRGSSESYLRLAGVGVELSMLPGLHSDLTLSANAYTPVNERFSVIRQGSYLIRETMPVGGDLGVGFQLPALTDYLDARVDARAHSFRGAATEMNGYDLSFSLNSRDGVFAASVTQAASNDEDPILKVNGTVTLAVDWERLAEGRNPFSAPYTPGPRFTRDLRADLTRKTARTKDLPTDRSARRIALAVRVWGDTVSFGGGFPSLPNSRLVVQTSQSPWTDHIEVTTDSKGFYSGQIYLPPGTYRFRLIHKPTRVTSQVHTVTVAEEG